MSLHVHNKVLTLPELLGTQTALELLQIQVKLFVDFEHLRVVETLATALPFAFELPLSCVSDHVPFQGVLVAASLSTFRTYHLGLVVMLSHLVTQ